MSGIARIAQGRDDAKRPLPERAAGREVWLKDGDQLFLTSVATGEENDKFLDEIYLYTFRVGNRWTNLIKDEKVDTSGVPEDARPSHKFAFWAYVHNIIHSEKRSEDWMEIEGPAGKKVFREDINDFRIVPLGFGRSDHVWNQLVDVYSDWGALNKGVLRIKRTGAGAFDTSYSITATPKIDEIPADKVKETEELPLIKDYYLERYGNTDIIDIAKSTADDDDELF
tara:strand:- start:1050 stop:1727 length:678 start_codon:yes stop_codon:yes gene_type:complete